MGGEAEGGEEDGRDYHFLSEREFESLASEHERLAAVDLSAGTHRWTQTGSSAAIQALAATLADSPLALAELVKARLPNLFARYVRVPKWHYPLC